MHPHFQPCIPRQTRYICSMKTNPLSIAERRADIAFSLIETVQQDIDNGLSADYALARIYSANRHYGSKDRRFYSALIFAWFRWKGLLRPVIQPDRRLAAALAYCLDGNPFCAELTVLGLTSPLAPVPTDLAGKLNWLQHFFPDNPAFRAAQLSPDWIYDMLALPSRFNEPDYHSRLQETFQNRPPVWLRFNQSTPQKDIETVRAALPDLHVHPENPLAACTYGRFNASSLQKQAHHSFELQDLASQCVGTLCQPAAGESWWDVCSGSGGKTLHLADLMNYSGQITATDIRETILKRQRTRLKHKNHAQITTRHIDAIATSNQLFDGILIDAPCSSIGTWGRNPDARWRLEAAFISSCSATQLQLLETAAPHLKSGGRLIYSVCTLTRAETTENIRLFLKKHPEFSFVPVNHPLSGSAENGQLFVLPWEGPCNGMFIACLQKMELK